MGASPWSDFGHCFQIQRHGEGEEWMGKLSLGSPRAGTARRGRSRQRPFLEWRSRELDSGRKKASSGAGRLVVAEGCAPSYL